MTENPEVGADGKIPLELELDKDTNKKLEQLSRKYHKPKEEVLEKVINTHLNEIENGKICCFCNKNIKGMGNNPAPVSDIGRCCDDCNINKVLPARYENPNWRKAQDLNFDYDKKATKDIGDLDATEKDLFSLLGNTLQGLQNIEPIKNEVMGILIFIHNTHGLSYSYMIAGLKDYHPKPEITSDEIVSDVLDFLVKEDAEKIQQEWMVFLKSKLECAFEFMKFKGVSNEKLNETLRYYIDEGIDEEKVSLQKIFKLAGGEEANKDLVKYSEEFNEYFDAKVEREKQKEKIPVHLGNIVDFLNVTKTTKQLDKMNDVPFEKKFRDMPIPLPDNVQRGIVTIDEWLGDPANHEIHFKMLGVPENDRMRNYQIMIKHLQKAGNKNWRLYNSDLFKEDKEIQTFKEGIYDSMIVPIIKNSKPYEMEDDVMIDILKEMNVSIDYNNVFLPYPFMVVDCPFNIEDRKYFGFFLFDANKFRDFQIITGKHIDPQAMDLAKYIVLSIYAKVCKYDDDKEPESKIFIDMFGLNDASYVPTTGSDKKIQTQVRKFVCHFLVYHNQKEIVFYEHEPNPKNSERRRERGLLALPTYTTIRVSGKLKIFVDKYKEWKEAPEGHNKPRMYSFDVPTHNFYFHNKKRFWRIYKMQDEELEKHGYTKDEIVNKGLIYRKIKGYEVGKGLLKINRVHKIVKE